MTDADDTSLSKYIVKTERLGMSVWHESDLELAVSLWGDPRVTKLIDARGRLSREQVYDRLSSEIASQEEQGMQYWPVYVLADGEFVGCCGLRPHDLSQLILEIGTHIRTECWGHGYASEAALGVMAYAFDILKVRALFAGHNPANHASRALLSKLGFRYTRDEYYEPTGLNHPSYLLTVEEYRASGDSYQSDRPPRNQ